MYYRVERTYLTDESGRAQSVADRRPYMIVAESAREAAFAFVLHEGGEVLGTVSEIAGDKATATAVAGGRMFVIFLERGADALDIRHRGPSGSSRERDREYR